jgi:hypothetical protein
MQVQSGCEPNHLPIVILLFYIVGDFVHIVYVERSTVTHCHTLLHTAARTAAHSRTLLHCHIAVYCRTHYAIHYYQAHCRTLPRTLWALHHYDCAHCHTLPHNVAHRCPAAYLLAAHCPLKKNDILYSRTRVFGPKGGSHSQAITLPSCRLCRLIVLSPCASSHQS